jgi:hypothetical protein
MQNFFPMSRGDLLFLGLLGTFSVVSFLPWSRSLSWGGMAMQGWMMALLMVVAPTLALLRLLLSRPDQEDDRS